MVDVTPIASLTQVDNITLELDSNSKARIKGITALQANKVLGTDGSSDLTLKDVLTVIANLGVRGVCWLKMENNPNDSSPLASNWSGGTFTSSEKKLGTYSLSGFPLTKSSPNARLYSSKWSVHVWVKPTGTTGFRNVWDFTGGGNQNHGLRIDQPSNTLKVYNGTTVLDTAKTISAGAWHHVCITYDGTTLKCYVDNDGSPYSSAQTYTMNSQTLKVGSNSTGSDAMTGYIDDFRVFDYCLSAAQVAELYASGAGIDDDITKANFTILPFGASAGQYLYPHPDSERVMVKGSQPVAQDDGNFV